MSKDSIFTLAYQLSASIGLTVAAGRVPISLFCISIGILGIPLYTGDVIDIAAVFNFRLVSQLINQSMAVSAE